MSAHQPVDGDPRTEPLHEQAVRATLMGRLFSARQDPLHIGRFAVLERVGSGAMGTVWAAYDPELDRRIAIKVLHAHVGGSAGERVRREARAMATVNHPNVAHVYEVGEHQGQIYLAMEYVRGPTLRQWQSAPERTSAEILGVYLQVGEGLAAAHRQGVVHRDFKPDNAVVESTGDGVRACVLDFGLARARYVPLTTDEGGEDEAVADATLDAVAGTPAYMAPEQFCAGPLGPAADQFAYCVSLFEALWKRRPFAGDSVTALLAAIESGRSQPIPASPRLGWVRRAVTRGLAADPEQRHPSMAALLSLLRRDATRRRRAWLGAAAVVGGLAVAGVIGRSGASVPVCDGAEAQLHGVWDDERRDEVRRALHGVDRAYVAEVAERVERGLDRYAGQWVSAHREACEATRVRAEQSATMMDRRIGCLGRKRLELGAVTQVLATADEETVARADELVASLPALAPCSDVQALLSRQPLPSSAEAPDVAEVHAALARARALRTAGDAERALGEVAVAEQLAEGLRFDTDAEVALEKGRCLADAGEFESAANALEHAQRVAARRDDDVMFQVTLARMWLMGYRRKQPAQALALRPVAEGLAATPKQRALVHNHVGWVLHEQADHVAAEHELRAALEQWQHADGNNRVAVAKTRSNLAQCLQSQGKSEVAVTEQRGAVEVLVEALGSAHPDVAAARGTLGELLRMAGDHAQAQQQQRRALAGMREARGEAHPDVAMLRIGLASTLYGMGEYAAAEAEHRLALEASLRVHGATHPTVAAAHNNLAADLFAQGKIAAAKRHLESAIEIKQDSLGAEHPSLARSRDNLGAMLRLEGDLDGARREHRAALRIREAALGKDHPEVAQSLNNIAAVDEFAGDFEAAASGYELALQRTISARGESHPEVAKYRVNLAGALLHTGQHERAQTLYRAALASRREAFEPGHPEIAEAQLGLGQSLLLAADVAAALPLLESAHTVFTSADVPLGARAESAFALARALWRQPGQRDRATELAARALADYEADDAAPEHARQRVRAWLDRHD